MPMRGTTDVGLTYPMLQRDIRKRAARSMISQGPGGPLVFLWALGAAVFLVPIDLPVLIVPLTATAAAIAWRMFEEYARDREVQGRLARQVVDAHCPRPTLSNPSLQSRLAEGRGLFIEITLKVIEGDAGATDSSRDRLMRQAGEMLAMLHESARQAQELDRVLAIVGGVGVGTPRTESAPSASSLLGANAAALRGQAERVSRLTTLVLEQMQTLLLQLTQLGTRAADLVWEAELAREARAALDEVQAELIARQAVAEQLIAERTGTNEIAWTQPRQPREEF